MNKQYTIIQCSNYFEYKNFKDNFNPPGFTMEYADSTYTIKTYINPGRLTRAIIFKHAPTATITSVSFRNSRTIYTKLKD